MSLHPKFIGLDPLERTFLGGVGWLLEWVGGVDCLGEVIGWCKNMEIKIRSFGLGRFRFGQI